MAKRVTAKGDFGQLAVASAVLVGVVSIVYALSFGLLDRSQPELAAIVNAACLVLAGLLSLPVVIALYQRLQAVDRGYAAYGALLGTLGAIGSIMHGGYDLGSAISVPYANPASLANLPSQSDPRGLLTFAVTGLAIIVRTLLFKRARANRWFVLTGFLLGAILIFIYFARLIIVYLDDPLIVATVIATGLVINP